MIKFKLQKPENILVSYDLINGEVKNFDFKLADWGTAGWNEAFFGGTPGYASRLMFLRAVDKDLFSIGRLAMDLFVNKTGNVGKSDTFSLLLLLN